MSNQRTFFRVDDTIGLMIRPVAEDAVADARENFESRRLQFSLSTHFRHCRQASLPSLKSVRKRSPETAAYLEYLEGQIIHLATQLEQSSVPLDDNNGTVKQVNLSADGMRFETRKALQVGDIVELLMQLQYDGSKVYTIAKVVRVEESDSDGLTLVAVQFEILHPEDKEVLIRHTVKVQQLELQSRRAG